MSSVWYKGNTCNTYLMWLTEAIPEGVQYAFFFFFLILKVLKILEICNGNNVWESIHKFFELDIHF